MTGTSALQLSPARCVLCLQDSEDAGSIYISATSAHVMQDELVAVRQQLQGAQEEQHRLQKELRAAHQSLDSCHQQLQDSQVRVALMICETLIVIKA